MNEAAIESGLRLPASLVLSGFNRARRTSAITKAKERTEAARTGECGHLSQSMPIIVSLLPIAVATNQPPIMSPRICGGATFETSESPIGLSISSPSEITKYAPMIHQGETRPVSPP